MGIATTNDCGKAVSCKEERVDQQISMDTNNPTPPNGKPDFDSGDWRAKMPTKTRQTLVKTITRALKRNLPFCGQEGGLNELEKIAMMIEESDFDAASSAPDYLWRISLKLISMDTKCRNKVLSESDPNNMASAGVQSSAVPFVSGPSQNHVSDVVAQNSDVQNVSGFSQDSMWQGSPSNIVADQMMQIQGRQQVVPQQELQGNLQSSLVQSHIQQQPQVDLQSSLVQPHMQQQPQGYLQSSLVQSHMQQQQPQENLQSSLVQSHMQQQQQQNILQPSQLNSSQQSDSTAQMEHANVSDQQERSYQKLKAMKDAYLPEIQVMHQKISAKLLKYDSLPLQITPEKLEKLKLFAILLERVMHMLTFSRDSIVLANEERLNLYEEQIRKFIHTCREARKPVSALQQEQDQVENQMNPQSPGPGDALGSMQQQHVAPATYELAGFELPEPEPAAKGVSTMSIPRFSTDFIKPNAEKPHDSTANSHALGSMQQHVAPGTYEQAGFEYPAPEPAANGMSTMFIKPKVAEKPYDPAANKANDNSLRSTVVTIVDEASTVVGEDLAAVRKQGLLAFTQTGMSGAFKIRCYLSALVIFALIICFIFNLNH